MAFGFVVVWPLLMMRFGEGDIYAVIGPYACLIIVTCLALRPRELLAALKPTWRSVLSGLAVGAVMTLLTYPAFRLATHVVPWLDGQVQALYHGARSTTLPKALAWITAIGLAEELLFRGLLPLTLQPWRAERHAFTVALVAYTLAQLGTGSLIVALLALVCGALWSILILRTDSLLSSVIAHAIWSPTVIVLLPVT